MCTRVIANRCIGKNIARDSSLVASRPYRMAVTPPQSRVVITITPECSHIICDWQSEEKQWNCNWKAMCNSTSGINAGHKVHCHRNVTDGSDWPNPLWQHHSLLTELFFADVASDRFSIIMHGIGMEASLFLGRDLIGWRKSKTTGKTLRENVVVR